MLCRTIKSETGSGIYSRTDSIIVDTVLRPCWLLPSRKLWKTQCPTAHDPRFWTINTYDARTHSYVPPTGTVTIIAATTTYLIKATRKVTDPPLPKQARELEKSHHGPPMANRTSVWKRTIAWPMTTAYTYDI